MTMKDWEKIIEEKDQIMWRHKEEDAKIIMTNESKKEGKKWIVGTFFRTGKAEDHFSTKAQAMAFAKAYMSKN